MTTTSNNTSHATPPDLIGLAGEAVEFGFSHAGPMDPATLRPREAVRDMCAANLCGAYNTCWMCPPALGGLDASREVIAGYRTGLIVQTTAVLDDPFDYDTMLEADQQQKILLEQFRDEIWTRFPDVRALGNGACTVCETCTYPDAPCRCPDRAIESMEAFGLIVTDVCTDNHLDYYYGPSTITYTGCYLLERA